MSTEAKHTPGPWTVDGEFYVRCKAYTIASMWMGIKTVEPTPQRAQANARLIARAPEMADQIARLEADKAELATLLDYAVNGLWTFLETDPLSGFDKKFLADAREYVAKHKHGKG